MFLFFFFFFFFLIVVVVFFIKGLPFALLISASKLKFFFNSQNYCRLSTPRGHIDFKTTIAVCRLVSHLSSKAPVVWCIIHASHYRRLS